MDIRWSAETRTRRYSSTGSLKVLCVVPACGGPGLGTLRYSRLLAGKPLLAYTAETALAAPGLTKVVVSTDDEEVADVGRRCGLDPCLRPAEFPRENVPVLGAVQDAVRRFEGEGGSCEAVCILDPASPFRGAGDIERCIELLQRSGADSVVTVIPVPPEYHPCTTYLQAPDGSLRLSSGAAAPPEKLPPAFQREGSICIVLRDVLMNENSLCGEHTAGYVVDSERLVRVERSEDWGKAERIAKLDARKTRSARIAPLAGPRLTRPAGWRSMPVPDACAGGGVGPLGVRVLVAADIAGGEYREPVRKNVHLDCRKSQTAFPIRAAQLPAEDQLVAAEFLDQTPPALVFTSPRTGQMPRTCRIEDPFTPHAERMPDVRAAEGPANAALARRHLGEPGLRPALTPEKREVSGGSHALTVAIAIPCTTPLGKGASHVRPIQPFALTIAELGPAVENRARIRPMPQPAPAAFGFAGVQRVDPESRDLQAREQLVHTPALPREGRSLDQRSERRFARVELLNTTGAQRIAAQSHTFSHPLAGAPPALVWSRAPRGTATYTAQSWEVFAQESARILFGTMQSRTRAAHWPPIETASSAHRSKAPAKAGTHVPTGSYGMHEFATPAASMPASKVLRTRLGRAQAAKAPAPSLRPDQKTLARTAPVSAPFGDSSEPQQTPLFHAVLKTALMPHGVFHYVEIEDYDDFGTMKRAAHFQPGPAMPDANLDVRVRAGLAAAGYNLVFVGSCAGSAAKARTFEALPPAPRVALGDGCVDLIASDFGGAAESGSSRWRISLKKTAGFFT